MKPVQVLPGNIQAGTMMIAQGLLLPKLEVETDAFSRQWRSLKTLDSFTLRHTLDAMGWHLFFVGGQLTSVAFGLGGAKSLHKAVQRITAKMTALGLNCLELTDIARKHFLGVPYIKISAHSHHIQQGWQLENQEDRRRLQRDVR